MQGGRTLLPGQDCAGVANIGNHKLVPPDQRNGGCRSSILLIIWCRACRHGNPHAHVPVITHRLRCTRASNVIVCMTCVAVLIRVQA